MNNANPVVPDLTSPRAILERAKKHQDDYTTQTKGSLWRVNQRQDCATGDWVCELRCDRRPLIAAKPILADCATNIASALDNMIGAMARANGSPKDRLYFPSQLNTNDFDGALRDIENFIGQGMAELIREHREKDSSLLTFLKAAKVISNTGKHWELLAPDPSADGIAVDQLNGKQKIYQVPTDAFRNSDIFEFYRGSDELRANSIYVVDSISIKGLPTDLPDSPDSILSNSLKYTEGIIDAVAVTSQNSPRQRG